MLIGGKDHFKVGFEVQRHVDTDNAQSTGAGLFSSSNLETALPGRGATGNAIASFLLGEVDSANATFFSTELGPVWHYYSAYLQDDFKVSPKLTLNLGLRWEVQTTYGDNAHRLSYMDPFLPNPGAGGRLGAYTFAEPTRGGWDRPADTRFNDFGPRIGFAYNFSRNWVVRGGYGIFYYGIMDRTSLGTPANGFNTNASFSAADTGVTPAFNWNSGFPQTFPRPPSISPTVQNGHCAQASLRSHGVARPYSRECKTA